MKVEFERSRITNIMQVPVPAPFMKFLIEKQTLGHVDIIGVQQGEPRAEARDAAGVPKIETTFIIRRTDSNWFYGCWGA